MVCIWIWSFTDENIRYFRVGDEVIDNMKSFDRLRSNICRLEDKNLIKGWGIIDDNDSKRSIEGDIWTLESVINLLVRYHMKLA